MKRVQIQCPPDLSVIRSTLFEIDLTTDQGMQPYSNQQQKEDLEDLLHNQDRFTSLATIIHSKIVNKEMGEIKDSLRKKLLYLQKTI